MPLHAFKPTAPSPGRALAKRRSWSEPGGCGIQTVLMILPCLAPQQADRATCPIFIKLYASHTHETGRTGAQAGSSVLHWTGGAPALLSECACLVNSPHRRRRRTFMEERLRTAEEALRLGRGIKACEEMRVRVLTQCITWSHLAASIKPAAAAAGAAAGGGPRRSHVLEAPPRPPAPAGH